MGYRGRAQERQDLLLAPHHRAPAAALTTQSPRLPPPHPARAGVRPTELPRRVPEPPAGLRLAYAGEYVVAELTLPELLTAALPLSGWWHSLVRPRVASVYAQLAAFAAGRRLDP